MHSAASAYKNVSLQQQREQLILEHLGYVRHILGRLVAGLPDKVDVENLESAGVLGLVEAARQFEADRGAAFTTFAYPRIRGAILDELRRNCPLPQQVLQRITKVRIACEKLAPPCSPESIARETGLTVTEVEQTLEAMRLTQTEVWHESMLPRDENRDRDDEQPGSGIEKAEAKKLLADAIAELPERERLVITLYYLEDLRLKEIAKVMKLSESRISRILASAEFRVKQMITARGG